MESTQGTTEAQLPSASPSGGTLFKAGLALALVAVLALPFVLRPSEPMASVAEKAGHLPTRKLVIISPHWEGIRSEFARGFSTWTAEKYGHATELEWLDVGGTSDASRYVRSHFSKSPEGIGIDLFFGGGVDPFLQFSREGLLRPCRLPREALEAIPQKLAGIEVYDPKQQWFGACLAGFGIIYNKKVLEYLNLPPPGTWEDLAHPRYFTWVGSGDPRSSGSVHMVYEIIAQAYGWDKGWGIIVRMGGNIRNFARSGSAVPKDTALGEVACGMAIDVYAWRQVAEAGADRMGFCLPDGLTVVNPDGIGILKGNPNKDLADKFVQFVITEPGQKLWVMKQGVPGGPKDFALTRMPIIPGFAKRFGQQAAVTFDPYTWKAGFTYDSEKGSRRWGILNDLIGATIIDTHDELVAAWRVVKQLPPDDPRVAELVRPPVSDDDLLKMAKTKWNDPAFRARTRAQWCSEARQRYRRIARGE